MSEASNEHCEHCLQHHELQVRDLNVSYQAVAALRDVSLETSCGNCVALIGPNGAGKSTLLKSIAGLLRRDSGAILWRGAEVRKWSREIAYLPQREEVDWQFPLTVRGLVEMGRYPQVGWWRRFRAEDRLAVDAALSALGLQELQRRQISALSGGQQQRAFLARAVAQEAHVLLLDEPFTGLDSPARRSLASLLRQLAHEGRLVIASHHDVQTAPEIFDQTLLLDCRPVAFGPTGEVLSPANLERAFHGRSLEWRDLSASAPLPVR